MRILYYDCFSGISGDMNLGALVDLGVPGNYLLKELKKLNVSNEYNIHIEKGTKQGITGTSVKVYDMNELHGHEHNHEHSHGSRNYNDIKELISNSEINSNVKKISLKIFDEVAKAEAKVHNKNF